MTAINDADDFGALDPFFRIVEEGLSGLADGDSFFDLLADGVVFEYIITVPGYPRSVVGRSAVAELYRPYGDTFVLHRCFGLAVHRDRESGVVVLEYASEGRVVATGTTYANRSTLTRSRSSKRSGGRRACDPAIQTEQEFSRPRPPPQIGALVEPARLAPQLATHTVAWRMRARYGDGRLAACQTSGQRTDPGGLGRRNRGLGLPDPQAKGPARRS